MAGLEGWPASWAVVCIRTDGQCIQRKMCKKSLNRVSYEVVCKSIQYSGVRFVAGVTNVIYESNVEGLELEILQLRNNLNHVDKFFCKTAQHTQFHSAEKFCNER